MMLENKMYGYETHVYQLSPSSDALIRSKVQKTVHVASESHSTCILGRENMANRNSSMIKPL